MNTPLTAELGHICNWIFDLDNTLYRADADFFSQIDRKMTDFISRYLALQPEKARALQKDYLVEYGTSLSGLMAVHGMDPAEFLDYVHDVDLSLLTPDPALRDHISALPGRKFIFTNGSKGHAKNVASHLGIFDLFDGSFGIEDGDYVPKPKRSPYIKFCDVFDVDPKTAIFFEDGLRNLEVPKHMGMTTVLVTSTVDWSHEPADIRPAGHMTDAAFVDHITNDLTGWLGQALERVDSKTT